MGFFDRFQNNKRIDDTAAADAVLSKSLLYGAVIGDVVGSKYEFDNIKTKDFPLFSEGCGFTDDTVMTIAVANALLQSRNEKERLASCLISEMQRFGRKYPNPLGAYGGRFADWLESEEPQPYNSFGNGSAMRVSACAIYAVELEEALELAEISAAVTHNHPEGIKGAKATAAAIYLAKTGVCKAEIKAYIAQNFYPLTESIDEIRAHYTFDESCQGTVPQAITAFLESDSFEDAIRNAVSIGGDTDTVAAITGSIAWAFYLRNDPDKHDTFITQTNARLPQEFIDTMILFEKKARNRASAYHRMTDASGFTPYIPTRVGVDHGDTLHETKTQLELRKWYIVNRDRADAYNNTAEYYCIAADGTVFKKEIDDFYALNMEQMVWQRNDTLRSVWNGNGTMFREYPDFKDCFAIAEV